MTTSTRNDLITAILVLALAWAIGLALLARLAHADPPPPDPVVAFDHADHTITTAPPHPVVVLRPTRWAQFRAFAHRAGENTGGAWLAAIAAIGIRRARRQWPGLRRGWRDEVTATAFASTAWIAGSLATGATWATAALGVVMAALAGGLIAMIPGERPAGGAS